MKKRTKSFHRKFWTSNLSLTSCLIFTVLLFTNLGFTQRSFSPKADQYMSVGGEIVASGTHQFSLSDPPNGTLKGAITVNGPGYIGLVVRKIKSISPRVGLRVIPSGRTFVPRSLGGQSMLRGSGGKWIWEPPTINQEDYVPNANKGGWVPEPTQDNPTFTLEVWASIEGGSRENDDRSVEYEVWYFPLEGGKVISTANINKSDVFPSPSGVEKPLEPKENPNITVNDKSSYPTSWQVNCNGYVGLLEYTVDPNTNKISGTLLNTPAEGYLVDRHLVLHRYPQGKTQIWDGWIMDQSLGAHGEPYYNDQWIIAGTGSQSLGSIDGVYPWYGTASGTGGMKKDPIAGVLDGLRWEMPCASQGGATCRATVQKPTETTTLGGDPNQTYEVTLRFRGVVEYHSYTGGQKDGLWYVGGRSNQGSYNIYKLETSNPPQTFYLNADRASLGRCFPIDYTRTIKVNGGATVILSADAQDGALINNHDGKGNPIIVPGVPPAPNKYNGQFIQMDVIQVKAI